MATPFTAATLVVPPRMAPGPCRVAVTVLPAAGMMLPKTSVIRTTGCCASTEPLATPADGCTTTSSSAAAAGLTVAVNTTGVRLPTWAVRVLLPEVAPRVQLPTVAMPLASVSGVTMVTEPSPTTGEKMTLAPATGLPLRSTTSTEGSGVTGAPAVPVSVVAELAETTAATPAVSCTAPEARAKALSGTSGPSTWKMRTMGVPEACAARISAFCAAR